MVCLKKKTHTLDLKTTKYTPAELSSPTAAPGTAVRPGRPVLPLTLVT